MKDRLYITNIVPMKDVGRFGESQASTNFNLRLISMGLFSKVLSIPSVNVGKEFNSHFDSRMNIHYHVIRFLGPSKIGHAINSALDNIWAFIQVLKSNNRNIWFYNIDKTNIILYTLCRILLKKHIFIILADFNPDRNKGIIGKCILKAIRNSDGVLSLSSRCKEANNNFISIPGIIPFADISEPTMKIDNNIFMLSGYLNRNTGVDFALNVFKSVPRAKLIITGHGDEDIIRLIQEAADKYENIEYRGFFNDYNDFLKTFENIKYILSFRNPATSVNKYNFPSKILESLSKNKVVISTMKYPELDGVNYISLPFDKDFVIAKIDGIVSGKFTDEIEVCIDNNKIIKSRFTEEAWISAFEQIEYNCYES